MAKRQDLKRKLKSSDRRRRRRNPAGSANHRATAAPAAPPAVEVDVSGEIIRTILDVAEQQKTADAAVIAALRGCLHATSPGGDQSRILHQRLIDIPQQSGVDQRSFRSALTDVMALAKSYQDPDNPNAFIHYLAVLAG